LQDVVYINSNPYISHLIKQRDFNPFLKIIDLWMYSDYGGSVHPKQINEYIINNFDYNSNKKLIIHYIQPHFPTISKDGKIWPRNLEKIYDNYLPFIKQKRTIWRLIPQI
jgi:hypothetical protein